MISPVRVAYMFLVTFSAVMIGISLTYLTGFISGGFVGLWFVVLLYSGAQVMMVDTQKMTTEQIQAKFKEDLKKTRPRKKVRREIL
ncbi:hypothetical protein LCGC14_2927670 [marine sediment metagenome]|uniref:Uncharacterized protein n=1 Tax=marine sediment metagenome TaxID=412755 RepID=A0A0F9ACX9_9ZZZZ